MCEIPNNFPRYSISLGQYPIPRVCLFGSVDRYIGHVSNTAVGNVDKHTAKRDVGVTKDLQPKLCNTVMCAIREISRYYLL